MGIGINARGLRCPHCNGDDLAVKDSRPSGDMIRRRRLCGTCGARSSSFEAIAPTDYVLTLASAMRLHKAMRRLSPDQRRVVEDLINLFVQGASPPAGA